MPGTLKEQDTIEFQNHFDVNVMGGVNITKAAIPFMNDTKNYGRKNFNKEMQKNIKLVKRLPKAKGFTSILYPGERKNKTYKNNLNKDISIPAKILKELNDLHDK